MLQEQTKAELRDKLRVADDGNREMISFIRNLQQQGDVELGQMRNFLQSKITEDQQVQTKNNEKNSVLFQEMVRLGEENSKYAQKVAGMQNVFEAKLAQMEQRLAQTEQSGYMIDKKGESSNAVLSELIEKVESRLLMVDQQVLNLKGDLGREKENLF